MLVKDLHFEYRTGKRVLSGVSFEVQPGDCLGILGNNGAGKSTLLKCLCRILRPKQGSISLGSADLLAMKGRDAAQKIAFVPQESGRGPVRVCDAVLLGRKPYMELGAGKEDWTVTEAILDRLGLSGFAMKRLDQLSGGEFQKVILARALAQEPEVLLLDEPTSSLDLKNQHEVLGLVRELCGEGNISAIMIIHDLNLALRYCNKLLFLNEGRVYAFGGPEIVSSELLEAVYGVKTVVQDMGSWKNVVVKDGILYE